MSCLTHPVAGTQASESMGVGEGGEDPGSHSALRGLQGGSGCQTVRPGAATRPMLRLGAHTRGTKTGVHGAQAQMFSAAREQGQPGEARLQAKDELASEERRTCAKDEPALGEKWTCRPRTSRPRERDGHAGQGAGGPGDGCTHSPQLLRMPSAGSWPACL